MKAIVVKKYRCGAEKIIFQGTLREAKKLVRRNRGRLEIRFNKTSERMVLNESKL